MKRNLIVKSKNSPTNDTLGVASVGDEYELADGSTAFVDKGTVTNTRKVAGFAANFLKAGKLVPVVTDPVGELFATRSQAAHAVRDAFDAGIGSKEVSEMTSVEMPPAVDPEQAKRDARNAKRRAQRAAAKKAAA